MITRSVGWLGVMICLGIYPWTWTFVAAQGNGGLSDDAPDVPQLIIPEELRVEADRLEAEEDAARAARENAEDARDSDLLEPQSPSPRFERRPARRLSDLHRDERSIERIRIDCRSEIARRDVTLFANGTIRLRQGPLERQIMRLEELGPEELTTFVKRLIRIRKSDEMPQPEPDRRFSVDGQWMDSCRLTLDTPGDPPLTHLFNPSEMQPLPIGQLMLMASELSDLTRPLGSADRLPIDYEPEIDDVLRRRDGMLYRVISPTSDGKGVELESLMEPLTAYYRIADLPRFFASKVDVDTMDVDDLERALVEPDVLELEDRKLGFSAWGRVLDSWDEQAPAEDEDEDIDEQDSFLDVDEQDPGDGPIDP